MNISREKALESLKQRIKESKKLIICDPFILRPYNGVSDLEYIHQLLSILPNSLLKLIMVTSVRQGDCDSKSILLNESSKQFQVDIFQCPRIHDRVWILDNSRAFVTGTSFNSIGYRLSFINNLNRTDFEEFWHFLVLELGDEFKKSVFE